MNVQYLSHQECKSEALIFGASNQENANPLDCISHVSDNVGGKDWA